MLKSVKGFFIALAPLILVACAKDADPSPPSSSKPNVLLIIADDLGKDALSGFNEGSVKAFTPNIDMIRSAGLSFNNFWVNPTCTPTRSAILTGKYGYRTGVKGAGDVLSTTEISLQQYISNQTSNSYASALIGKWHLSGNNTSINPEDFGIDYYAGLIRGAVDDYYQWQLTEDGTSNVQNTYITESFTNIAMDWIGKQDKAWFLWLAYTAPHTPYHVPPAEMHSQGSLTPYTNGQDPLPYYLAAIEAMDYQIGRLLNSLSPTERANTVIVFLGDNGAPNSAAQLPYTTTTVKNTLYQGGINVPLFISGKGITKTGNVNALVNCTDLFATLGQIAGVSKEEINDSKSFIAYLSSSPSKHRDYLYAELNDGTRDQWTIRDEQYKLIVTANGNKEMYDLASDPYEAINLLSSALTPTQINAKNSLENQLDSIRN